jgi:hypothetical protein
MRALWCRADCRIKINPKMHVRGKGHLAALLAWPPFMQNCKRKQSAFLHWFGGMLPSLFAYFILFSYYMVANGYTVYDEAGGR